MNFELPKGWKITKLKDVVDIRKGLSYKSKHLKKSEVALINLKCIARGGGFRADGIKPYV